MLFGVSQVVFISPYSVVANICCLNWFYMFGLIAHNPRPVAAGVFVIRSGAFSTQGPFCVPLYMCLQLGLLPSLDDLAL